jgi:nitrite reductase/ring-hydroxylating ferredoxin subunit/uncharacterized membrane protein
METGSLRREHGRSGHDRNDRRQEWLRPIEEAAQHAIHRVFRSAGPTGQKVKNALHGTWLGHPLHAALTDVPIGAWTAAMVFDVIDAMSDRREFRVAADSAMTLGVVGALGAAVAGLIDWQDTDPPARRMGLMHSLLNVGGVALFAGSLAARRRNSRALGRTLSALGYAVATVAARLGGNLVYGQRVGVDHTVGQSFPNDFVPVLAESELPEGSLLRVEHRGTPILLAKRGNRIFALAETCSHLGGPLSEGEFINGSVKCPWHGSRFALEDGRVLDGPAVHPQPCLEARARNGQIEVRKAIESRSVSGAARVPAIGEALAPANRLP